MQATSHRERDDETDYGDNGESDSVVICAIATMAYLDEGYSLRIFVTFECFVIVMLSCLWETF